MITFLKSLQDSLSKGKPNKVSDELNAKEGSRESGSGPNSGDGSGFSALGLSPVLCDVLAKIGYENPTPIQSRSVPAVIEGRDLLGLAQTGTGKTAAFALAILERLLRDRARAGQGIKVFVVTPTRELAIQVKDSFTKYGSKTPYRTGVLIGGVKAHSQVQMLERGVDILVSTPGRFLDLHGEGHIDLSRVSVLVLDEADRMLDMGFIHDVKRILKIVPPKRQNLFFSATMPDEVSHLAHDILRDPVRVEAQRVSSTNESIDQSVYFVETNDKLETLIDIIKSTRVERALVFVKMKWQANRISEKLSKVMIASAAIHGNKSQNARQKALQDFKTGEIKVLVASDLAARGLDVTGISHVFNYDLPDVAETYVHRIGRTGRGGATGHAIAFCSSEDAENLRDIEKLIGHEVPRVNDHSRHSQLAADLLTRLKSQQKSSRPHTPSSAKTPKPGGSNRPNPQRPSADSRQGPRSPSKERSDRPGQERPRHRQGPKQNEQRTRRP